MSVAPGKTILSGIVEVVLAGMIACAVLRHSFALHVQLGAMEGVSGVLIYLLEQLKEKLGVVHTKVLPLLLVCFPEPSLDLA